MESICFMLKKKYNNDQTFKMNNKSVLVNIEFEKL